MSTVVWNPDTGLMCIFFQTDVNDAVDAAFMKEQEINNPNIKGRRLQQISDSPIDISLQTETGIEPLLAPTEHRRLSVEQRGVDSRFSINFFYFVNVCIYR